MKIEVVTKQSEAPKVKGDLLELLSKDLLKAQGYSIIEEIRVVGAELDLLCKHNVNNKEIYVECKAHKEKLGAPVLRQLLGSVIAYDYTEGWLISTSEFGKDAKGFLENWKKKPIKESSKLSFYSPENIVDSLQSASIICKQPIEKAVKYIGNEEFLGEWTLLITNYGRFWAVYTLQGGAPYGVLFYNAKNARHIQDIDTINNLEQLHTELVEYDLRVGCSEKFEENSLMKVLPNVIEVQTGDSWDDYRPSRPQDFIGREDMQKNILGFFNSVKTNKTDIRIFAITGNSGLGKSSLIAKLRDRTRNKSYRKKYFIFAVDIRGAKNHSYILASLLQGLKNAQESGFGDKVDLQLTNPTSPLTSPSISKYLETVKKKGQVICLIFDQFEELYSKPELFNVFKTSNNLMLDVASFKGNITLGFAWKTDSTTQQDHPAYHMWHNLSDYRRVYKLDVFNNGENTKVLTAFEKEIKQKIPPETRYQIAQSSQGFPWLLKKLCINLYENIKKGKTDESILIDLDVGRLFQNDLELLSPSERTCLQLIAQKAPADWSEIIEASGISTLNGLVHKRLVVRSGDHLNIYWDIFKDYLLTKKVPVIPFNYIPTCDLSSMLKVSNVLIKDKFTSAKKIAELTTLNEKTVGNIGADLVMFGLAERKGSNYRFHQRLEYTSEFNVLEKIREKFGKNSLKLEIYKKMSGKTVDQKVIVKTLKESLPNAKFSDKTWATYAKRLTNFLIYTGYFIRKGRQIVVQDTGVSVFDRSKTGLARVGLIFSPSASPASVCEVLKLIEQSYTMEDLMSKGYRNSLSILKRFELVSIVDDNILINKTSINKNGGIVESVWTFAKNEPALVTCINIMEKNKFISAKGLGKKISELYNLNWTEASMQRNGNALRQWATWIHDGIKNSLIPLPPGRSK